MEGEESLGRLLATGLVFHRLQWLTFISLIVITNNFCTHLWSRIGHAKEYSVMHCFGVPLGLPMDFSVFTEYF